MKKNEFQPKNEKLKMFVFETLMVLHVLAIYDLILKHQDSHFHVDLNIQIKVMYVQR